MSSGVQEVFSFNELSDKAKEAAIERYAVPEYDWWDSTYDHFKEAGKERGFIIEDIQFSGFYSQGSGACWDGYIDVVKWITLKRDAAQGRDYIKYDVILALLENDWIEKKFSIYAKGSYNHEGSMVLNHMSPYTPDDCDTLHGDTSYAGANVARLMEEFVDDAALYIITTDMLDDAKNYAREIYRALQAEYDSYFDEESFADTASANEWKFDENGKIV